MADGMLGADTSIYNRLGVAQPQQMQQRDPLQTIQQIQGLQGQKIGLDNAKLDQAQKHIGFLTDQLAPLIAMGPNVSAADVTRAATNAVARSNGAIQPQEAMQFVSQVTSDPRGIPAALQQANTSAVDALSRISVLRGQTGSIDNGVSKQATVTNSYDGSVNAAGGNMATTQVYPSRAEMASSAVTGYGANGAPQAGTTQQRLNNQGGGSLLAPAFRAAPAGQGGGQATAGGAPATTPGPQEVPMESMVKARNDDYQNSSAKMQGIQPLLQAIPLVQSLGPSGAGPTSAGMNDLKSFLVTRGVIKPDDTNVDVRNEANKYLKKYVTASGATNAGGSDYRTAFTSESNPNLDTDQKATLSLAKSAVAFDRMDAARPLAFNGNANDYGKHKASWAQSQDPRAYGLDLMDPPKRQALLDEMKAKADTPQGRKFWNSLKIAHDNGMLTGPTNAGQ